MQFYQFNLPDATNAGSSYAGERLVWENEALKHAGGFTSLGEQQGAWMDGNGRPQWERMHVYQVAASEEAAFALEQTAFKLFADQQSIFIAKIGTARLAEPKAVAFKPLPPLESDPGCDGRDCANDPWNKPSEAAILAEIATL